MAETHDISALPRVRYEILPLGRGEEEAQRLPEPVRLTVTCSPKYGPDRSVEVATRLRALGHSVTVHIAARMVRDRDHLATLLDGMAQAGADDLLLIAGDADPAVGIYASAVDVLPVVAAHPRRPATIGIAGYPEGHPKISDGELREALRVKSAYADYVATQMCFDPTALRAWVRDLREERISLPVYIGIPGKVSRAKLLELSARIGVGPSLDFLRKQRGLSSLLSRGSTADRLYDALVGTLEDPALRIAGFHIFTFNQLYDTWEWERAKDGKKPRYSTQPGGPRLYVHAEKGSPSP